MHEGHSNNFVEGDLREKLTDILQKLYKFNLKSLKWENIEPNGKLPSPRDKISGWRDENGLCFWGGFGSSFDGFLSENGEFVEISNFLNLV